MWPGHKHWSVLNMISHIVACHLLYHFSLWYIHTDSVWLLMVSLCVQWIDIHSKINKYLNSWRHSRFMILLGILTSIPQCIILEIPDPLSKWYPIWFLLSNSGNSDKTLHYGNVVRIPYWLDLMFYMSYIYKQSCYIFDYWYWCHSAHTYRAQTISGR